MSATATQLQRLLAEEFERRGWEYDLSVARAVVDEVLRSGRVEAMALARLASKGFLARTRASQADLAEAIATAFARVELAAAGTIEDGKAPMRVLFVAAGPADESRLRLDAEHRDVRSRIRASTGRSQVVVETCLAARPTDLIDELNRCRPTILHLAGHGGSSGIALEDDRGAAADVTTDQLVRLVALADAALRLVVLNTCESAYQAQPMVKHVDAAIGMTQTIGDEGARAFAAQLYSSLAEGVGLERAFGQARLQLTLSGFLEDKTPKLFVRRGVVAADVTFVS